MSLARFTPWLAALPPEARPRERLLALGGEALHDAELLALVLGAGAPGRDALATGWALAQRFPELRRLATAGVAELASVPGVGLAKACRVKAALALAARLVDRPLARGEPLGGPEAVYARVGGALGGLDREVFMVIALDVKHRVLGARRLAEGGLCSVAIVPRDVLVWAVREGAVGMVVVHNHPSGDPSPSGEDRQLTERLARAGELIGVTLVDHLIVAQGRYFSFAREGWFSGLRGSGS